MLSDTCTEMGKVPSQNQAFYVYFDDAEATQAKAVAAGFEELQPVQEMFWGDKMGVVKDKFGYTWNIATHVKEVSAEEMAEAMKQMASAG